MKKLLPFCLLTVLMWQTHAQSDSVWVDGRVIEATTGCPQAFCEVQLLQSDGIKALAFCDDSGNYTLGWVPAGSYTLSLLSGGKTLYYATLELDENAQLNIALMPATEELHTLAPVKVSESKHLLGSCLITSPDNRRLWNFNGNPALMDIGPASEDLSWPGGRNPLKNSLAKQRPEWLDAPFPKEEKKEATEEESEN